MKTTKHNALVVKSNVKAGGLNPYNHNKAAVVVKSNVKADGLAFNHNRSALVAA